MPDMVQINRDPFARQDIVRRLVETNDGCDECGRERPSGKLFQYGVDPDSIGSRTSWLKGLFCCKGCAEAYHGQKF